ncbi:MAG: hypothetical protein QF885_07350 [Candidatus Thalassarchaeaceae archaeon]|jgi:hypothetical protein|nr:hypothetical protein [Candidatus Thalassarchaeaceae archaeon]
MFGRRVVAVALLALLLMPLTAPAAAEWEEDSWLSNIIGPERLALGDEFGCHGMPNVDISTNNSIISQCRDYLTERIEASKWGAEPLSFGLPSGNLDADDASAVSDAGFKLIDSFEEEIVESPDGLSVIQYNGGSLEKNVGSTEQFDDAVASGAQLVNFFWIAREHDVVVRPDSELINSIESRTAWFTTWGEHYSYQETYANFSVIDNGSGSWDVEFVPETGSIWAVPVTSEFTALDANVISVQDESSHLAELAVDEPHLKEGWREDGDSLFLTLAPNHRVNVSFDRSSSVHLEQVPSPQFNGHNLAITVAGHHTSDLFDWSRRWDDSPMRFTWLVEPRDVVGFSWLLPTVAVLLALAAPVAIIWLVKNDRRAQQMVSVFDSLDEIKFGEE